MLWNKLNGDTEVENGGRVRGGGGGGVAIVNSK